MKEEGYENANGIYNRLGGNEKLERAKDLINELGADVVAYNEHSQNLWHKDNRNGRNQLFRGGEADVRSVVAHNVHEADRIGRVQEGGTGLLMFGPLTEYLDMRGSEKDVSGLGRWTTMLLKGGTSVQTRITFRLGGQIEFGIIHIHTQLNTTVYIGITIKQTKKNR